MRLLGERMGAVERYAHPKVWSPSGGWWANPPNWQRNTMKLAGMWIVPAMFVFAISVSKEVSALHCRAARGGLDAHVVPLLREKEELSQKKTRRRGGESVLSTRSLRRDCTLLCCQLSHKRSIDGRSPRALSVRKPHFTHAWDVG
jgi:hypothetical protein